MTNDEFKCWINGYLVLSTEDFINLKQLSIIKNHINLVKSVEGALDLNVEYFLAMIEDNIKTETILNLSELKEAWSNRLTLSSS